MLLAVYEVVTQSHSYRQQSKHIDVSIPVLCIHVCVHNSLIAYILYIQTQNEVVGEISSFIKTLTMLNREVCFILELSPLCYFLFSSLAQVDS